MTRRLLLPALALCLSMASSLAEEPPFKLTGVKLFSDKFANKVEKKEGGFSASFGVKVGSPETPGTELSGYEFPETQRMQFFSFQLSPAAAGKKVSFKVIAEKTTIGAERSIVEVDGTADSEGVLPARVSMKRDWPVGLYRAELTSDGKPVGQLTYLVKAVKDRVAPIKLKEVGIFTMENDQGVERKAPKTTDHYLEFHADTIGANTAGATVVWKLSLLDEAGKPANEVSTVEMKDWPLEDTTLVHSVELPKDWPVGKYVCEYTIDGKLVGTKTFEIK